MEVSQRYDDVCLPGTNSTDREQNLLQVPCCNHLCKSAQGVTACPPMVLSSPYLKHCSSAGMGACAPLRSPRRRSWRRQSLCTTSWTTSTRITGGDTHSKLLLVSWVFAVLPISTATTPHACWRRYVGGRNNAQLRGVQESPSNLKSCDPELYLGRDTSAVIDPCGIVAWSYFNDTYQVT